MRENLPQTDALHCAAIAFLMVQGALKLNLLCLQTLHQMGPLTLCYNNPSLPCLSVEART